MIKYIVDEKIDNPGTSQGITNANRRVDNSSIGIGTNIADIDKRANNQDTATGIANVDRKADNAQA